MNDNRRKFLKTSGSLAVGGLILSVVGRGVWKMFTHPEQLFNDSKRTRGPQLLKEDDTFVSPYRRISGFLAPDDICAMEVAGGSIYLATPNNIYIYGMSGELQTNFPTPSDVRDITVFADRIYALYPTRIEVYDRQGDMQQQIEACSPNSDYCALAVCQEGIYVTDAANKNICRYNPNGSLACFIQSPHGFIVPSYSFGITYVPAVGTSGAGSESHAKGTIYCSNPGRHLVESYTTEGQFIASFGKPGAEEGAFSGCCNPVIITPANNGELLTSEKGIPRISCYGETGKLRSVLLDKKALGGGNSAYDVRILKDKLIVTGGNKVSIFQYDKRMSQNTKCGQCDKDCPLKVD